jgi:hypothetical protein
MCTLCADQPGRCDSLQASVREFEDSLNRRGVVRKHILPDADQLGIPLGRDALASDGLAQDALGLRLRDEQHERVTALDMPKVETEHALAAAVDASESPFVAKPEHLLGQTALLEEFERARLDANGSRRRGWCLTLVNEAYGHSHARQFQRSSEACRPRANDQDRICHDIIPSGSGRGRIRELSFAFRGQFSLFHCLSPPECCLPLQRHRAMHWPLYSISNRHGVVPDCRFKT